MPDWLYRTCARPALFCMPDHVARALALGIIGSLGRSRPGRAVIEFMGHMAPHSGLSVRVNGVKFSSPIGLGWRVDPERRAPNALSCFGAGCVEIREGPSRRITRGAGDVLLEEEDTSSRNFRTTIPKGVAVLIRRSNAAGGEVVQLPDGRELPVRSWDQKADEMDAWVGGAVLQVGERRADGKWSIPTSMPIGLPDHVREWRRTLPVGAPLIVSGGVGCPSEACTLIEAGADLLLIDGGLVHRGPGLVKRCNDAILKNGDLLESRATTDSVFRRSSFWSGALGLALLTGGVATLFLAMTRVLLPYDEQFLGFSSSTLRRNSPRLFAFMAHDRGTLAGTMLGLGWMYFMLARNERHGTKTAVIASALAGFVSFFGFFGFGYFDTLHAFVAAVLLQFTIQVMVGSSRKVVTIRPILDVEDRAWRKAQWAQLLWVTHSVGLIVAGVTILGIGMTTIFVSEDLNFLCVTERELQQLSSQILGVVAHDRATLGGMLLSSGVAMLLPVLWCFRRGERWLWWAIAGLGFPAYGAALGIHVAVGYLDWRHMVPAVAGLLLWLGGLVFSASYLAVSRNVNSGGFLTRLR